jgi:hypothetical protein
MRRTRLNLPAACLVALLLAAWSLSSGHAATRSTKDPKPDHGRIEVTATPAGHPILIDGQMVGQTSPTTQLFNLPPGTHTVEIQFPHGVRWVRDFCVEAGRRYCIALNYQPKTIAINRPPAPAEAAKPPCQYDLSVSAPQIVREGDIITFAAVTTATGAVPLNYRWTVSPATARIVSGEGTPALVVDTTGYGGRAVTAELMVDDGSGEAACQRIARATTTVQASQAQSGPSRFDEFPVTTFDDVKARLDNFAIQLQNTPGGRGYIIVYGGRESRADQADRLGARAEGYLTGARGIEAGRLTVIKGGRREREMFELWLVPTGATPPQPTPTLRTGDVKAARAPRLRR